MTRLRRRFWVYVFFVSISMFSIVYARWSIHAFDQRSKFLEHYEDVPFFHPIPVWDAIGDWYTVTYEPSDPSKVADFILNGIVLTVALGVLGLLLFGCLTVYEITRWWDERRSRRTANA